MVVETSNPHEFDEDPEQCLGALVKDPWNDESQEDWPTGKVEPEGAK